MAKPIWDITENTRAYQHSGLEFVWDGGQYVNVRDTRDDVAFDVINMYDSNGTPSTFDNDTLIAAAHQYMNERNY